MRGSHMPLQTGARLGPYEVVSLVGAGGMGEVYRARDTRLGREVAIKVLPADRITDTDRRRRFVQEAQAASALNHPHIITIYEIESADDNDFIVMEYVRGKSLDGLIPRQGMRLNEALRIAIAVADALAAAHARGIIHRDLKPANVIVGSDGAVKVLDFGLAKLTGDADTPEEDSPTLTSQALVSAPGTIAGTAAYMAPEQATGGTVDARADIFSFGAMLYEMVTGSRAFPGASTAETLDAVIRAQPKPPSAVVAEIQGDLEKVILRCLRKDPQRRYQHIADVKVALEDVKEESESGVTTPASVVRTRRRGPIVALVALVIVAAMAWLLLPLDSLREAPAQMRPSALTTLTGSELFPTFSPHGEHVAFSWNGTKQDNWDVYVTLVGSSDVRRLTSDPGEDARPKWSPDGRQIAFVRQRSDDSTIHLVSPLGGSERRLGDFRGVDSLDWSPDGEWLAAGRSGQLNFGPIALFPRPGGKGPRGIYLVSPRDGDARPLIVSPSNRVDSKPVFSPDGRRLAYASCASYLGQVGMRDCDVAVVELDASRAIAQPSRRLTSQQYAYIYSLAWTRDGSAVIYEAAGRTSLFGFWRVTIDGDHAPERIETGGDPAGPAVARSRNRLAFTRISLDDDIYRFGAGGRLQLVAGSSVSDTDPRLSPDGRRLAFASARAGSALSDIWIAEADGSNPQQLTRGPGDAQGAPSWSPDGRRIVFDSRGQDSHFHLWMIDADGGAPRRLTAEAGDQVVPTWSHEGRWIYYSWWQADTRDIWRVPADGGGPPERMTHGAAGAFACESADGSSLLFQPEDADSPLMTMPLAGGQARQLISCVKNSAFGVGPRGLYYVPCDSSPDPPVFLLDPKTSREVRLGTLDGLWPRPLGLSVSPDGNTIMYPRQVLSRADLMLIENFR
jgi:serine/threonine protein kinase/dipeptidyl aminopeptidase/acylaminoacyl peptidase